MKQSLTTLNKISSGYIKRNNDTVSTLISIHSIFDIYNIIDLYIGKQMIRFT